MMNPTTNQTHERANCNRRRDITCGVAALDAFRSAVA